MKSLRTIKDSNLYTAWFNSIDKDIKLHWYVCVRHGKLPGVIGALKACREMLEKAKEVVDTVLRLCLVSPFLYPLPFHLSDMLTSLLREYGSLRLPSC